MQEDKQREIAAVRALVYIGRDMYSDINALKKIGLKDNSRIIRNMVHCFRALVYRTSDLLGLENGYLCLDLTKEQNPLEFFIFTCQIGKNPQEYKGVMLRDEYDVFRALGYDLQNERG